MPKIIRYVSILLITLLSITFFNALHISDVSPEKNTSETYSIKALKIPSDLTFAGEKVPTELYDIKETFYNWSKNQQTVELSYLLYFLVSVILLLFIIFGARKLLYSKKAQVILMTCDEQAISDLEKLFDQKLWKNENIQEHFVRFSFILRQYLTLRYELSFLEKTTSQAKILLVQLPIEALIKNEIMSLLLASDYIKFADSKISEANILKMKVRALEIIETTTPSKEEVDG